MLAQPYGWRFRLGAIVLLVCGLAVFTAVWQAVSEAGAAPPL